MPRQGLDWFISELKGSYRFITFLPKGQKFGKSTYKARIWPGRVALSTNQHQPFLNPTLATTTETTATTKAAPAAWIILVTWLRLDLDDLPEGVVVKKEHVLGTRQSNSDQGL